MDKPIHKRDFDVFISHATQDKPLIVDPLLRWLKDVANIKVWIDSNNLVGGVSLPSAISTAIPKCKAMVIVMSEASVRSNWVEKEINKAIGHQNKYPEFKIIPIRVDDCSIPETLQELLYIDALSFYNQTNHEDDNHKQHLFKFYNQLLKALYPYDPRLEFNSTKDIFVSRGWRGSEEALANKVCHLFVKSEYRLVGDSKDHPSYSDSQDRVKDIISSCGGFLSILPHRPDRPNSYYTSPYCISELKFALELGLPCVVIAAPQVKFPEELKRPLKRFILAGEDYQDEDEETYLSAVETMNETWSKPVEEHYIFFASKFGKEYGTVEERRIFERNKVVCQVVRQVTGMSCKVGKRLDSSETPQAIARMITKAKFVISDISHGNVNTSIEAGIAWGANVKFKLISASTGEKRPFMFGFHEVEYYQNDADLLGYIHRFIYPYRRRIINYELK